MVTPGQCAHAADGANRCFTLCCPAVYSPFDACRYHSLVIKRETIPEDLEITAWTEDGNIMGVRHKKYPHIQVR